MAGYSIKVTGLDEVLKKLDVKKFEQGITDELAAYGADVSRDAKQNVESNGTTDNGRLVNSIDFIPERMSVEIVANVDYAAYVEFGTGPYAAAYLSSKEQEWKDLARQFYVNGEGRMPAQPFIHPAIEKNRPSLLERLNNLLNA